MHTRTLLTNILLIGSALAATGTVAAADWRGAKPLNTGFATSQEGSIASDPTGYAISVWIHGEVNGSQTELQSRTISHSGELGPLEVVTKLSSGAWLPRVHTTSLGNATVFWADPQGIWTADKPLGAGWSKPELIIPGSQLSFRSAENQNGSAAVVAWRPVGQDLHPDVFLTAVERVGNKAWTRPSPVVSVSGYFLLADDIAVSNNGDAVVAWEDYHAQCVPTRHRCFESDVSLHASRLKAGSTHWQDSGRLLGPYSGLIGSSLAMDAAGDAGLVAYVAAQSFTQPAASSSWHGPVSIDPKQAVGDFSYLVVASDAAGHATVVGSTHNGQNMTVVEGSIVTNQWGTPQDLQTGGYVIDSQQLAISPNGRAVTTWHSGGDIIGVYGSVREGIGGSWTTPALLTRNLDLAFDDWTDGVAIADTGAAYALFDDYNHSYTNELMYVDMFR